MATSRQARHRQGQSSPTKAERQTLSDQRQCHCLLKDVARKVSAWLAWDCQCDTRSCGSSGGSRIDERSLSGHHVPSSVSGDVVRECIVTAQTATRWGPELHEVACRRACTITTRVTGMPWWSETLNSHHPTGVRVVCWSIRASRHQLENYLL